MTWVVGVPTMFGYSVGLADIQATITFNDGSKRYFDCVQKIFPIERFIVAGFCGSIEVGFLLIEDLKRYGRLDNPATAWVPDLLVLRWRRRARRIFSRLPIAKRKDAQIILVGVYPQRDNGIPNEPQSYCCIMKSPEFEPEKINPGSVGSIGSGNDIEEYVRTINAINNNHYHPIMQMEVNNPGGYGRGLMMILSMDVENNPTDGISKHFHYFIIRRGGFEFGNNDHPTIPIVGQTTNITMPTEIAKNWREFMEIMCNENINLAECEASA